MQWIVLSEQEKKKPELLFIIWINASKNSKYVKNVWKYLIRRFGKITQLNLIEIGNADDRLLYR